MITDYTCLSVDFQTFSKVNYVNTGHFAKTSISKRSRGHDGGYSIYKCTVFIGSCFDRM
jgi:hypothetical protein